MNKTLLAIDTSTENCSVALQVGDQLLTKVAESPREHSQRLLPFVQELLQKAELELSDVDALVVGCGPGSFTGVRIGVSIGQGLAYSQQLPVYPVSSLQALAQQRIRRNVVTAGKTAAADLIMASIDARMSEVYYGLYENVNGVAVPLSEPAVAQPNGALFAELVTPLVAEEPMVLANAGTGWDVYRDVLSAALPQPLSYDDHCRLPEAQDMLTLVNNGQVKPVSAAELEPLYVRNEVTWKKLPGRE